MKPVGLRFLVSLLVAGGCFAIAAWVAIEGIHIWRYAWEAGPVVGPFSIAVAVAIAGGGLFVLAWGWREAGRTHR